MLIGRSPFVNEALPAMTERNVAQGKVFFPPEVPLSADAVAFITARPRFGGLRPAAADEGAAGPSVRPLS